MGIRQSKIVIEIVQRHVHAAQDTTQKHIAYSVDQYYRTQSISVHKAPIFCLKSNVFHQGKNIKKQKFKNAKFKNQIKRGKQQRFNLIYNIRVLPAAYSLQHIAIRAKWASLGDSIITNLLAQEPRHCMDVFIIESAKIGTQIINRKHKIETKCHDSSHDSAS